LTLNVCGVGSDIKIYKGEDPWRKGAELSEFFWGLDGFGGTLFEN
jgi:hypothetical protein